MRLNITVDGMSRLANHVKKAQTDNEIYKGTEETEDFEIEEDTDENMAYSVVEGAVGAFMDEIYKGIEETEYHGFKIKKHLLASLEILEKDGWGPKGQLEKLQLGKL